MDQRGRGRLAVRPGDRDHLRRASRTASQSGVAQDRKNRPMSLSTGTPSVQRRARSPGAARDKDAGCRARRSAPRPPPGRRRGSGRSGRSPRPRPWRAPRALSSQTSGSAPPAGKRARRGQPRPAEPEHGHLLPLVALNRNHAFPLPRLGAARCDAGASGASPPPPDRATPCPGFAPGQPQSGRNRLQGCRHGQACSPLDSRPACAAPARGAPASGGCHALGLRRRRADVSAI